MNFTGGAVSGRDRCDDIQGVITYGRMNNLSGISGGTDSGADRGKIAGGLPCFCSNT